MFKKIQNKKLLILLFVLIILFILLTSLFIKAMFFHNSEIDTPVDEPKSQEEIPVNIEPKTLDIKVYDEKKADYVTITTYDCKTNSCYYKEIAAIDKEVTSDKYVILIDGGTYLYNVVTKEKELELETNQWAEYFSNIGNELGLVIHKDDTFAFYKNKKITDYKYKEMYTEDEPGLEVTILFKNNLIYLLDKNDNYILMKISNGKEIYKSKNHIETMEEKFNYFLVSTDEYNYNLYDFEGNAIINEATSYYVNDSNIYASFKDGIYREYNNKGEVLKTSKQWKEIFDFGKDYIFVLDSDNFVKVIDYNDNIFAILGEWNEKYEYISFSSGYDYEDYLGLDVVKKSDKTLWFVYDETPNETNSTCKEYYYIFSTKEVGTENHPCMGF